MLLVNLMNDHYILTMYKRNLLPDNGAWRGGQRRIHKSLDRILPVVAELFWPYEGPNLTFSSAFPLIQTKVSELGC